MARTPGFGGSHESGSPDNPILITEAATSLEDQHRARVRKYMTIMAFRIPALILAALAYGAVGPNVIRLRQTEAFLIGQLFDEATLRTAGELAVDEISPIDDVRGSADYRRQLARNVLLKLYHQRQASMA